MPTIYGITIHNPLQEVTDYGREQFQKRIVKPVDNTVRRVQKRVNDNVQEVINYRPPSPSEVYASQKLKKPIQDAANRNGVSINDDEGLKKYHSLLEFDPENPDGRKLFSYLPPKNQNGNNNEPKPLVVLVLGNKQTRTWDTGINTLAEKFNNAGYPVIVFRTGDAQKEISYRTFMSSDSSLDTTVVYQHTKNIIEDALYSRGRFKDLKKPNGLVLCGYSFGGGTVCRFTHGYNDSTPIIATATIDSIKLGTTNFGKEEKRRPKHNGVHFNAYQRDDLLLYGGQCEDIRDGDISMQCNGKGHVSIIEDKELQDKIFEFLVKAIDKSKRKE